MPGMLGTIAGQVRLDIRQAVAAYATLRAQNQRTVYALRGTSEAFISSGRNMFYAGGLMVAGFGMAIKEAAEFERKMDFFGAVTDTNAAKMEKLSKFTLQLAQDTIYSAGEIADGMIELGKAGVKAEQIMGGIGQAMANLGAAGDIPLMESGQIITSTIQQFDLAAKDAVKVTDLLAGAANASIADITDIGVSLKYVGGVASASGLTFEDTATAISLLAKAGIRGSTAGTSLRQMIVSFGGATEPARDALKELGILMDDGTNKFYTQEGALKPLSQVYEILNRATADLTQKQKLAYLRTIFNNRALSAAAILTRDGAKGFKEMNKEMSKVSAADVAAKRLDNLSGDIEILKGNIQTLLVQAGGPFQETARKWVKALTNLVQAFGELDPETQKMIVQSIAMAGAVLLAMGAFNLIIGTVLKFIAHMLKMGAGIKFLFKMFRILIFNARFAAGIFAGPLLAALGAITLPIWLIIAAVVALVAGFIIAYKKSETFRNIIQAIGKALAKAALAVWDFMKLLATDPGAAWDKMKKAAKIAFDFIVAQLKKIPGLIADGFGKLGDIVGAAITATIDWFKQLPGQVLSLISSFISKVISYFTLDNLATVVGYALAAVVHLFVTLPITVIGLLMRFSLKVVSLFLSMSGRILSLMAYLVGFIIGFLIRMTIKGLMLAARFVLGIVNFFRKLPGRIGALMAKTRELTMRALMWMKDNLPRLAREAATGIGNFFQKLPGRVNGIFKKVLDFAIRWLSRMPGKTIEFARKVSYALYDGIKGLPGLVGRVLGDVIEAFKGVIRQAFDAAKGVAKGLWDGFKDGIGMNSPSNFHRAMVQVTGELDKGLKQISKRTLKVQGMAKKMAATEFSTGAWNTSGRPSAASFASMHATNQKRSQSLLTPSSRRSIKSSINQSKASTSRFVQGELDITPNGRAFIRGVAEDAYADNENFVDAMGRAFN